MLGREYLFEDLARINVEVEYASEFRYRNPIINEGDIVLAISQSGETADTMAALELAKSKGATILESVMWLALLFRELQMPVHIPMLDLK